MSELIKTTCPKCNGEQSLEGKFVNHWNGDTHCYKCGGSGYLLKTQKQIDAAQKRAAATLERKELEKAAQAERIAKYNAEIAEVLPQIVKLLPADYHKFAGQEFYLWQYMKEAALYHAFKRGLGRFTREQENSPYFILEVAKQVGG